MKPGDYVVANDDTPMNDPAWDIGIVQAIVRQKVHVWWLLADDHHSEARDDIREATHDDYEFARLEKGIDR